jgi:hypothetical protein
VIEGGAVGAKTEARFGKKELNNGVNLFDALMNAARIDKDAILIPKFVDCRATAVRVSCVEDLQQVPFDDLLD